MAPSPKNVNKKQQKENKIFPEIQFKVTAEVSYGDEIVVCGGCAALGNFIPKYGIRLTTTPTEYPVWTSPLVVVPPHEDISYKYVVYRAGQFFRWEGAEPTTDEEAKMGLSPPPAGLADLKRRISAALDPAQGPFGLSDALDLAPAKHGPAIKYRVRNRIGTDEGPAATPRPAGARGVAFDLTERTVSLEAGGAGGGAAAALGLGGGASPLPARTDARGGAGHHRMSSARRSRDAAAAAASGPGGEGGGGGGGGAGEDGYATLSAQDGVVVASCFLPVEIERGPGGRGWAVRWDHDNVLSLRSDVRVARVGTPPLPAGCGDLSDAEKEELELALQPFDCVPVWLEADLAEKFYSGFCKGVLWPVFHNMLDVYGDAAVDFWDAQHLDGLWFAYTQVNRKFRDRIVEVYNDRDLVWVHGFHLLLVPSFLSRSVVAKVGLFLHTPFPSSEIFRTLPFREDLLRGMLVADQIGFHVYEYSRHFLTCCVRLLGLTHEQGPTGQIEVRYNGRQVLVTSVHAGVDPEVFEAILRDEAGVAAEVAALQARAAGKFVFLGLDKVERLKGLQLKLVGYARFLERNPDAVGKVLLHQVGLSASELQQDYNSSAAEVQRLVDALQAKYPGQEVIRYEKVARADMPPARRVAHLAAADALVITSVRDGLNRFPLEMALTHALLQQAQGGGGGGGGGGADAPAAAAGGLAAVAAAARSRERGPGLNVLSQFSSCMRVLPGALHLNPWKVHEIALGLESAWRMSPAQRRRRHAPDADWVAEHSTAFWAFQVLSELKGVAKKTDRAETSTVGLGLGFRVLGMEAGFNTLDAGEVIRAYKPARRRLIFLDYGGTLTSGAAKKGAGAYFGQKTEGKLPEGTLAALKLLCADPRNAVFVVSGKDADAVAAGGLGGVPGLGLAAEHGLFFKWPRKGEPPVPAKGNKAAPPPAEGGGGGGGGVPFPGEGGGAAAWETLFPVADQSWRHITRTIMEIYVARTNGTYVEEKGCALIWQFRDADPEFGFMQSKELEDHLKGVLKPFAVDVLRGGGGAMSDAYIEVRPEGLSKGAFLEHVLGRLGGEGGPGGERAAPGGGGGGGEPEFALVVGDDTSDEPAFAALDLYRLGVPPGKKFEAFSCTVGKKPSEARSYVNDAEEVLELLSALGKVSSSVTKYYSYANLSQLGSGPGGRGLDTDLARLGGLDLRGGGDAAGRAAALARSTSMPAFRHAAGNAAAPVSMTQYFDNIHENEEEEDDDGVFF